MTLPISLKNDAEKRAKEYGEEQYGDHTISCPADREISAREFLAGVQWLFNKLTKAPEGFRVWTGVKSIVHEWSETGEGQTTFQPDDLRSVTETAALAQLRAGNEKLLSIHESNKTAYRNLKAENAALSERVKELEEAISWSIGDGKLKHIARVVNKENELAQLPDKQQERITELTSALEKIKTLAVPSHSVFELNNAAIEIEETARQALSKETK